MKTIAEWNALLRDNKRLIKNSRKRCERWRDKYDEVRRAARDTCSKCGAIDWHWLEVEDAPEYIRYKAEGDEYDRLYTINWDILDWIDTLTKYNEGEPKV